MRIKRTNKLDKFDMEAEAEGRAIKTMVESAVNQVLGKRIRKQKRMHAAGDRVNNNRIINRYLKG